MAYAHTDIRGQGSGCAIWFGDLVDVRTLPDGQDLYIRMPESELGMDLILSQNIIQACHAGLLFICLVIHLFWLQYDLAFTFLCQNKTTNKKEKLIARARSEMW